MSDFSTGRINSSGQLVFADENDSLGIVESANTTSAQQPPTIQAIGIIQGYNLGDGLGLYTTFQTTSRTVSGFKSLVAGSGVTLTADDTTITINSNFTNVLAQLSFDSMGSGSSIFLQKIAGDVQLRGVVGSGIVGVQETSDSLVISAAAVTSVGLTATSDFVVSGSPVTSTGSLSLALATTGATAGSYTNPTLTVDAKGRVTAISNGAVVIPTVQAGTGVTVSPGPNYTVGLTSTGVSAGTYVAASLIVDATGRITSATSNTIPGLVSAQNIGTGTGQVFASVASQLLSFRSIQGSGAISVSQTSDTITISAPTSGTVTNVAATGSNGVSVTGGPISTSGTLTVALTNTAVTAGAYTAPTITVDATGRITAATSNTLGEANTVSNLPGTGGYGLFAQKVGVDLQFRSLVAGDGIGLSSTANTLIISNNHSVSLNLTAVGTSNTNALVLTSDFNEVLTSGTNTGVQITAATGSEVFIANYSAHAILVYPPLGGAINALAVNTGYSLAAATSIVARVLSATKIYI